MNTKREPVSRVENDVMIDIESLDITPTCVILTIGAVRFDPYGAGVVERLELRPTVDEQSTEYGRTISESTLQWWSGQSADSLEEAMGDWGRAPYKTCMQMLHRFCSGRRAVWSNGASFDVVVLENAWARLGMQPPWPHYTIRDTRTLYEVAGVSLKDSKYTSKTTHKAIEDAEHQAIVVQDAYDILRRAGVKIR